MGAFCVFGAKKSTYSFVLNGGTANLQFERIGEGKYYVKNIYGNYLGTAFLSGMRFSIGTVLVH